MRIGVVGTLVWDRIHTRDNRAMVEEWGGATYSLAGLQAAAPSDWTIVPIMKVGRDMRDKAYDFLRTLPNVDLQNNGIEFVDEPNNRVELRYLDAERRVEQMSGGVPPWRWEEIRPHLQNVDALYVNFLSGFEMNLETAQRLRLGFHGPIYADLHSLFLGIDANGVRVPRPLEEWREWIHCFDIVQVNEEELALLAHFWGDPWRLAAQVVGEELRLMLVTLGMRGAAYFASPSFSGDPQTWRRPGMALNKKLTTPGSVKSEKVEPVSVVENGDPTGSGDVWGATCFMRLLAGDDIGSAMRAANHAASRNVEHRGATGLHQFLKGRFTS